MLKKCEKVTGDRPNTVKELQGARKTMKAVMKFLMANQVG